MSSRELAPLFVLVMGLLLGTLGGCRSAETDRHAVAEAAESGDAATETKLREALERHPEDVGLLVTAAEFHLRPGSDEYYRPRLALHYAMRADKAANYGSDEVGRTLMRAYRAAGGVQGTELGRRLITDGLDAVKHPDRANPKRLDAVDPDLLDPTLANVLEQERRNRARAAGAKPCADGYVHVPAGVYPAIRGDSDVEVEAFCVERPSGQGVAQIGVTPERRETVCRSLGGRSCTEAESAVACGALRTVVGRHTACEDERIVRCCGEPEKI